MTWYGEFDFDSNPLDIRPSGKFELFFDNKSLFKDVIQVIDKKENIVIKGELGTGKTSIIKRIIKEFGGNRKLYYYNAFSASSPLDFERVLKKAGGIFSRFFKIKSKEVVLFIDEAFHLNEDNMAELKNYLKNNFKSVILASSDLNYNVPSELKDYFQKEINFGKFTFEDAKNILNNRLGEEICNEIFEDEDVKTIYGKSKTPREFLLNCDSFCYSKYNK